jgi:hypothetical protein
LSRIAIDLKRRFEIVQIGPPPAVLSGQTHRRLLEQYEATEEAYSESLRALTGLRGTPLQDAIQRVLEARHACETCGAALTGYGGARKGDE